MVCYRQGSCRSDYEFFFDVELQDPLCVLAQEIRTEPEYDAAENPEKTALEYLKTIGNCFSGEVYLVTAGHEVGPSRAVRLKKTALWGHDGLRKLDARSFEVQMRGGGTRLVSVVDIKHYSYSCSADVLLNWVYSHIVFTDIDIDTLSEFERRWLEKDRKSVLAFDYSAVANDLSRLPMTSVLRYFPADNGRSETIAAIGQRPFVERAVGRCVTFIS